MPFPAPDFVLHRYLPRARFALLAGVFGCLAACSTPPLPATRPTVQQVPFLGQQLTKQQIDTHRVGVAARRERLKTALFQEKAQCYQRFFVNACLQKSQREHALQERELYFQDVELNRQERVLAEVDRQLRLQQKGRQAP